MQTILFVILIQYFLWVVVMIVVPDICILFVFLFVSVLIWLSNTGKLSLQFLMWCDVTASDVTRLFLGKSTPSRLKQTDQQWNSYSAHMKDNLVTYSWKFSSWWWFDIDLMIWLQCLLVAHRFIVQADVGCISTQRVQIIMCVLKGLHKIDYRYFALLISLLVLNKAVGDIWTWRQEWWSEIHTCLRRIL